MKKITALLLAGAFSLSMLAACSSSDSQSEAVSTPVASSTPASSSMAMSESMAESTADAVDVRVLGLKGPTTMGMVQFMDGVDNGEINDNNYTFEMVADTSEVAAKIGTAEVDIAAVPANLASVIYNNTDGAVEVLAINTLGVLYIVENGESLTSIEDLRGQTIHATGKGATPEFSLRYVLSQNGIDPDNDVTIEWHAEATEVLSSIADVPNAIAMLPEPFVTTALTSNESLRVALDLTEEWDAVQADAEIPSQLVTGVVIGRSEFIAENPTAVEAFLSHYEESINYINNDLEGGAALVGQYEIVPEAVALQAIPNCNITYIAGSEMKDTLHGYLTVLFDQAPESVGGALPDDAFYYGQE